jgi:hypothetical protein
VSYICTCVVCLPITSNIALYANCYLIDIQNVHGVMSGGNAFECQLT